MEKLPCVVLLMNSKCWLPPQFIQFQIYFAIYRLCSSYQLWNFSLTGKKLDFYPNVKTKWKKKSCPLKYKCIYVSFLVLIFLPSQVYEMCVNARYCGIVILFRLEYTLWILISKGSLLFKRVFITVVPDLLVVPNPADNLVAHGQH